MARRPRPVARRRSRSRRPRSRRAQATTPGPLPRFEVHRQPAHGVLAMRPEAATVKVLRTGAGNCSGRTYDGMAVYYTPSAGFHGTDTFDWTETAGPRPYHDTGIVLVK